MLNLHHKLHIDLQIAIAGVSKLGTKVAGYQSTFNNGVDATFSCDRLISFNWLKHFYVPPQYEVWEAIFQNLDRRLSPKHENKMITGIKIHQTEWGNYCAKSVE